MMKVDDGKGRKKKKEKRKKRERNFSRFLWSYRSEIEVVVKEEKS